jgi:hypothetical protein
VQQMVVCMDRGRGTVECEGRAVQTEGPTEQGQAAEQQHAAHRCTSAGYWDCKTECLQNSHGDARDAFDANDKYRIFIDLIYSFVEMPTGIRLSSN